MEFYIEVAKRISPIQNVLLRQDIETVPIFFSPPPAAGDLHYFRSGRAKIFLNLLKREMYLFSCHFKWKYCRVVPPFSTWDRLSSLRVELEVKINNRLVALWFFAWRVIVLQTLASLRGKLLPARNSSIGRFLFRLRLLTLEVIRVQWAKTSQTTERWFRNPFPVRQLGLDTTIVWPLWVVSVPVPERMMHLKFFSASKPFSCWLDLSYSWPFAFFLIIVVVTPYFFAQITCAIAMTCKKIRPELWGLGRKELFVMEKKECLGNQTFCLQFCFSNCWFTCITVDCLRLIKS